MPSSTPSAASIAPARPCTSPRCCATRRARPSLDVPLTLVVERPDGVEYRRVAVPDQGVGGRSLERADRSRPPRPAPGACAPSPIRSVRRSARPPSWSRTMCRTAWSSISRRRPASISPRRAGRDHGRRPLSLRRAGLRARARRRDGDRRRPRSGRALPATSSASPTRRSRPSRKPLEDLPRDRRQRQGELRRQRSTSCRRRRVRSRRKVIVRMAEAGGRAVERKLTLPVVADGDMIGVKPLFSGRSLGEGENASFDVIAGRARRQDARAPAACATSCSRSRRAISGIAATAAGSTSRSSRRAASPTASIDVAADKPGRIAAAGAVGPLPPRSVERRRRRAGHLDRASTPAGTPKRPPTRRTCWRSRSTSRSTRPGETMTVAVTARTAGTRHAQRDRRPAAHAPSTQDVQAGTATHARPGRPRLGHRRLCGRDLAPSARRAGAAHAGPRHRRAMVLGRPQGAARSRST